LRKDVKDKEEKIENLKKAIDQLNDRMIKYEKVKSDLQEDNKGVELVAKTNVAKL